jgi:hypothetical protein
VRTAPVHNASGKTLYREVQIATAIASVQSATQCTLAVSGASILVSQSSVPFFLATDDSVACQNAENAAWGGASLVYPAGLIGVSTNRYHESKNGLNLIGQGKEKTIFVDLRTASTEYPVAGRLIDNYGMLSFKTCSNIRIEGMSYDGSVPVLGMPHTTGGIVNNSGGRIGFFARGCNDVMFVECGYSIFGARDEHWYADASPPAGANTRWENCGPADLNACSNNNTINPGNVGAGCIIRGCALNSAYSCIQWAGTGALIADCDMSQVTGFTLGNGADPVVLEPNGTSYCLMTDCTIHDCDNHGYGNGLINVQGFISGPGSVVDISDLTITNNPGYFYTAGSAIIRLTNSCQGTTRITGVICDKNTAAASGGTFVYADGASTGLVFLANNYFRGRAGSNMTRGIVDGTVPDGTFIDGGNNTFGESVTTPWATSTLAKVAARFQLPRSPLDVVLTSFGGSPETNVVGSPGALCIDHTNGEVYIKKSGTSTNTGWKLVTHA